MKLIKRIRVIILVTVLGTSMLAGCANDNDNGNGDETVGIPVSDADLSGFVYVPEIIPFPVLNEGNTNIELVVLGGNAVYFTAWNGDGEDVHFHDIYTMDVDGTNPLKLPNYIPGSFPLDFTSGFVVITALHIDSEGNLWVAERRDPLGADLPDGLSGSILRKLDKTGAEIFAYDLSGITATGEEIYVNALIVDDAGNIYIASGQSIHILDDRGGFLFSLDTPEFFVYFVRLSDGHIAIAEWLWELDVSRYLKVIDVGGKSWGEIRSMPPEVTFAYNVYHGSGEYFFLYNDSHLNGIVAETGELKKLMSWADCAINAQDITGVMLLPDGRISAIRQSRVGTDGGMPVSELLLLTETPANELPDKIQLTFGTFYFDSEMGYAVEQFNMNSKTHSINVIDYAQFNSEEDPRAGFLRLSTEIIAGNCPDILDVQRLPFRNYISKDLLIDLYPLLDADPELNRSSIIESVLKASEIDGSLYFMIPSFWAMTIIGHPSVLGNEPGWTVDEFLAVFDKNPQADIPMGGFISKDQFFTNVLRGDMDEFIDWGSGTARFDSGEFIALLETANTFPMEIDEDSTARMIELIAMGRQIMYMNYFTGTSDFSIFRTLFGGDLVIKGFPNMNRNGNTFVPMSCLAITSNCSEVDAAWEFVHQFMLEDYQRDVILDWMFPASKAVFEERLEKAMIHTGSSSVSFSSGGEFEIANPELSQADTDAIRALIDNITRMWYRDTSLETIASESAEDYFNGLITAPDAARVIQNRVMIYISEQS